MNRNIILRWMLLTVAVAALVCGFDPGGALAARPVTTPGSVPDYFETPNWANSPPLRKFVDTLPGLNTANNLGQMIPVAIPDTTTYPGSDYYVIELVQFRERLHSDLPALNNADKMAATSGGTLLRGYRQVNTSNANLLTPHFLGPQIIAQKDRPVRIKFINSLPTGSGGNLFVPTDTSVMGAGEGPKFPNGADCDPATQNCANFTQNRATLHLHGGRTAWISDGTPHQWITPAAETTPFPRGVSVQNVPDMPDPGAGAQTFYYTNQQSARLLFYHDHSWGITRLNVYVGEAAGYLIQDPVELAMINGGTVNGRTFTAGTIPADQIPLIIMDKTFVDPATIVNTDPTWAWGSQPWNGTPGAPMTPVLGDLWWPHVYMPAQNPFNPDLSGVNAFGRWHYGPWFFPPTPVCGTAGAQKPLCVEVGPQPNPYFDPNCVPDPTLVENNNFCQPPQMPGAPSVSWGAEAFLDTMLVNGTVYPKVALQPKPYRFRVLNASHDRFVNLQLYVADATQTNPACPTCAPNTEVRMVPAAATAGFPANWPADGREGGVPDPATRGPAWIQIGTEGGFLPAPSLLPNHPVMWNTDPTMFNVGNVLQQYDGGGTLILGPAERADVIVDFTKFAGKTLILYNDAPTAFPALDPHYDYYTGAPDRTDIGGYTAIPVGMGPNIRTVMQINVGAGPDSSAPVDDYNPALLARLQDAFKSNVSSPGAFASGQEKVVVGQTAYNTTYDTTFPSTYPYWGLSRIIDDTLSFKDPNNITVTNYPMQRKAIHDEMGATFDDFGRMSAKLGLEIPFANAANQNFVLQNYVDPVTENVDPNVQIWRVTHNGVDTHPVHFHLFDVQLLNRVGWDGFIRVPDANELGWKDTIRMSPLEDTIVALRPVTPTVPFPLPNSVRPLNPAFPIGSQMGFTQIDPLTGGPLTTPTTNQMTDFGHEYVWHCHILSHEENDMMRSITFRPPTSVPPAPALGISSSGVQNVVLAWTMTSDVNNAPSGYLVQRRSGGGDFATIATINFATVLTYTDTTVASNTAYTYRLLAFNSMGSTPSNQSDVTTETWTAPTVAILTPTSGSTFPPDSTINLTANATAAGGTVSKVEYYNGGILLGFRTAAPYSFSWLNVPSGSYVLTAKVYTSQGATAVSVPVSVNVALSMTLNATPPSPTTRGVNILFTAAVVGDTGAFEYQYRMRDPAGAWSVARPYSTTPTWTWATTTGTTAGTYLIEVWARRVGSAAAKDVFTKMNYTLKIPATTATLNASSPSPQSVGNSITFTASASGGSGPYEYQFRLRNTAGTWSVARNYTTAASWTWNTTGLVSGLYRIEVWVRNVGSTFAWEAFKNMNYTLNLPVTAVSLGANPVSPSPLGTSILFTAAATGTTGNYVYQFRLRNPAGIWSIAQDYSATPTWTWNTTVGQAAGSYKIEVWAKNAGSNAAWEAYRNITYTLQ